VTIWVTIKLFLVQTYSLNFLKVPFVAPLLVLAVTSTVAITLQEIPQNFQVHAGMVLGVN
jgi:hypothetical protein